MAKTLSLYDLQTPDKIWHTEKAIGPTEAVTQLVAKLYPGFNIRRLSKDELRQKSKLPIISVTLQGGQSDKYKMYYKHYAPIYYYIVEKG